MLYKTVLSFVLSGLVGAAVIGAATNAEARGGAKPHFTQDYHFDKPMHGYSGRAGEFYCDYIRLPKRKCTLTSSGRERCKVVGWTLRQTCS